MKIQHELDGNFNGADKKGCNCNEAYKKECNCNEVYKKECNCNEAYNRVSNTYISMYDLKLQKLVNFQSIS